MGDYLLGRDPVVRNLAEARAMDEAEVFLSYAHADEPKVRQILDALRVRGFTVFIDSGMSAGVDWGKVLEAHLERAYAIVVVWSSRSVTKAGKECEWIYREASIGLEKDRLFPIKIEKGITPPERFKGKHAADLSDWNGDPEDQKFTDAVSFPRKPLGSSERATQGPPGS